MTSRTLYGYCIGVATVIVAIVAILIGQRHAASVSEEGEMWMQWDASTRSAYVTAYVSGLHYGFISGCNAGYAPSLPKEGSSVTEDKEYYVRCESRFPISGSDPTQFLKPITEFYTTYPRLRSTHISDILLEFYAGHTIEQIHDKYAPEDNRDGK